MLIDSITYITEAVATDLRKVYELKLSLLERKFCSMERAS